MNVNVCKFCAAKNLCTTRQTQISTKTKSKWERLKGIEEKQTEHLSQFGVVNQVRSVSVDESTQSQAVLPTKPQEDKWKHQRKVVEEVRRVQIWKGGEL